MIRRTLPIFFLLLTTVYSSACSRGLSHRPDVTVPPSATASYEEIPVPGVLFYDGGGDEIDLLDYLGEPVVLKFIDCLDDSAQEEFDLLAQYYPKKEENVRLFVIVHSFSPGDRELDAVLADYSVPYPLYFDPDGSAALRFQTSGVSSTFFIDADGFIAAACRHPITEQEFVFGLTLI